jgi:predicted TIM-barrel fold metal-dependent hydrolase
MVTISHCHVGAVGFGTEIDPEVGTIEMLVELLEVCGIKRAVVFAPFPEVELGWGGNASKTFRDPNDWLVDALKAHTNLFGFATINPKESNAPDRLRLLVKKGLIGAKVHPAIHGIMINDPDIDGFFQEAENLRLPIHMHTGVHGGFLRNYRPLLIDDVAQQHPNLPIILDHIGGYAFFHEALAVLHNNDNCYAGLSQCSGRDPPYHLTPERVDIVLRTVGAGRIVYGLDYPWNADNLTALKNDLSWVKSWQISEQEKNDVLGGNIERLIKETRGRGNSC